MAAGIPLEDVLGPYRNKSRDIFQHPIPVYRTYEEQGVTKNEIASTSEWKASAPEDVTDWFNNQVTAKSPDTTNGRQMRRMVRLLKYWSKSRGSWYMPSWFILSVLADEGYAAWKDRDDQALLSLMRSIRNRLLVQDRIYRPVSPQEEITNDRTVAKVRNFRNELASAIAELSKIEQSSLGIGLHQDVRHLSNVGARTWRHAASYRWESSISSGTVRWRGLRFWRNFTRSNESRVARFLGPEVDCEAEFVRALVASRTAESIKPLIERLYQKWSKKQNVTHRLINHNLSIWPSYS